jgi:hypothetical protein
MGDGLKLDTATGRPALHFGLNAGWITVTQAADGVTARLRLTPDEALLVADTLVDSAEKLA